MALSDDVHAFFDFESDMSDSHSGGRDFTENNSPTYSGGKVGNAADLVRSSSMWGSRTEAFPTGSTDLYIGVWGYFSGVSGFHSLFNKTGSYWLVMEDAGSYMRPKLYCYSSGAKIVTWGSNISSSTWYFLFAYHDDGTEAGLSVDSGTRVTKTATAGIDSGTNALAIGAYASGTHHLDGSIDSLGIFTGDPSTTRESDLWNSGSGVSYSDFSGGGGGYAGTPSFSTIMLDGAQFRCSDAALEKARKRLEAAGKSKRHLRAEHLGLRYDVRRSCLWGPARDIALPKHHQHDGIPKLILPGRAA